MTTTYDQGKYEAVRATLDECLAAARSVGDARVFVIPATGREARKNAAGRWECQPHGDNYWLEFTDLETAVRAALPPLREPDRRPRAGE